MSEIKQQLDLRLAKGEISLDEYDSLVDRLIEKKKTGLAGILITRTKEGYDPNIFINNEQIHKLKRNEQFYIEYPLNEDQLSTFVTIHAKLWTGISSNSISLELKDGEVYKIQSEVSIEGFIIKKVKFELKQIGLPSKIEDSKPQATFGNEIAKTVGKTVLSVFIKNVLQK